MNIEFYIIKILPKTLIAARLLIVFEIWVKIYYFAVVIEVLTNTWREFSSCESVYYWGRTNGGKKSLGHHHHKLKKTRHIKHTHTHSFITVQSNKKKRKNKQPGQ